MAAQMLAAAKPPRKRKRGEEHTEPHSHEAFAAIVALGRDKELDPNRISKARDVVCADWGEDGALIEHAFVNSVRGLQSRIPALAALVVAIGAQQGAIAERLCAACAEALGGAVATGDWVSVKGFLRFFASLARCGAAPTELTAAPLRALLAAAREDKSALAARQDTFAYLALAVIPWLATAPGGAELAAGLLGEARLYLQGRKRAQGLAPFRPVETQQYNFIQDPQKRSTRDHPDALDLMLAEAEDLRDGGWDVSRVIPAPQLPEGAAWRWAAPALPPAASAPPPPDAPVCYADLPAALHLFAPWDPDTCRPRSTPDTVDEDGISAADAAALDARLAMPLGDRLVLRECVGDLLVTCNASREVTLTQLRALPHSPEHEAGCAFLVVETVLSSALALPRPVFGLPYYAALLADLCKGKSTPHALALVECFDSLHDAVVTLDPELCDRVMNLFGFHLNNYSLKWLWEDWADLWRSRDPDQRISTCRKLFIFEVLQQLARQADVERLSRAVPKIYDKFVPKGEDGKARQPKFRYYKEGVRFKGEADQLLIQVRRQDFGADQAARFLDTLADASAEDKLDVLLQTVLFAGGDCVSHERHLVSRFAPALRKLCAAPGAATRLVASANAFWDGDEAGTGAIQGKIATLQNLLDYELVSAADVVRWIAADEIAEVLERAYIWEMLEAALGHLTARVLSATEDLVDLEGAMQELDTSAHEEKAKDKARKKLEKVIHTKQAHIQDRLLFELRAAFVLLFDTVADLLHARDRKERMALAAQHLREEEARARGEEPKRPNIAGKDFIWRRSVVGHLNAIGRRYVAFLAPFLDDLHEEVFAKGKAPPVMRLAFYDWRLTRGRRAVPMRGTFAAAEGVVRLQLAALKRLSGLRVGGGAAAPNVYDRLDKGEADLAALLPTPGEEAEAAAAAEARAAKKEAAAREAAAAAAAATEKDDGEEIVAGW
eukprot:TRINITY_DN17210_c0_g1_i1.p1 TRINITY_DN17210_c0_g1~~TRINITY_DN17210_c0_g1_i1.p1  ORF type:complete len:982 (+),score=374.53 TRINITY_DN17210_c0_g1_i1:90-2948(+)